MGALLRRAWGWVVAALGSVLLVVGLLWRRALGQRNEARRERDDAQAREAAARASAQRGEALRVDEAQARREHEAAVREITDRREDVEVRASEARADLWDAKSSEDLARIVEARRKSGRLP